MGSSSDLESLIRFGYRPPVRYQRTDSKSSYFAEIIS
jgi:hypothetical protein